MDGGPNSNLPTTTEIHQIVSPQQDEESSIRAILGILFRQKFYIFWFFIMTVTSVTVVTLLLPETYQSDAKLFIQLGRESMTVDPTVIGTASQVRPDRESELNSEIAALRSRLLAEQVVAEIGPLAILKPVAGDSSVSSDSQLADFGSGLLTRLGLKSPLPASEIAVIQLMKNFTAVAQKQSHIIELSIQSGHPDSAQRLLNALIEKYLDRHIVMHQAQAPLNFFETKSATLRETLEQKEGALLGFQKLNSMASMEGQKAKVLDQVSIIQTEIDQVEAMVAASTAKIKSIRNSLEGRSPNREINRIIGRPNRTVESIKSRLFELQTQEADLAAHYSDNDRALIDLREKIKLAEHQLVLEGGTQTEITHGVDTNYQALQLNLANEQAQLQALQAQQKILQGQLTGRQADLLELSGQEISLNRLQREIDLAGSEYQQYQESLQRARISADLDSGRFSNISIVQPPTKSLLPIKPRKKLNVLIGAFLGLIGGLGLAFLREYFDDTMHGPEDVEVKLGLPVLASISRKEFEACT